jgi:hypothetical protein
MWQSVTLAFQVAMTRQYHFVLSYEYALCITFTTHQDETPYQNEILCEAEERPL